MNHYIYIYIFVYEIYGWFIKFIGLPGFNSTPRYDVFRVTCTVYYSDRHAHTRHTMLTSRSLRGVVFQQTHRYIAYYVNINIDAWCIIPAIISIYSALCRQSYRCTVYYAASHIDARCIMPPVISMHGVLIHGQV
jgi:hypothetical protein